MAAPRHVGPTLHRANELTKSAYGSLAADGPFLEDADRHVHVNDTRCAAINDEQESTILQNLALTRRAVSWKAGGREQVVDGYSLHGHS
jgi:hypothetical protein